MTLLARFKEAVTTRQVMEEMGLPTNKLISCINPEHDDPTPSAGYDKRSGKYHCFGCGVTWDAFDILQKTQGMSLKDACIRYGVSTDLPSTGQKPELKKPEAPKAAPKPKDPDPDQTGYFKALKEEGETTDYYAKRGLTPETVERFNLLYTSKWRHPKAPKAPPSRRAIIPTSRTSYLARAIDDSVPKEYQKQKVGSVWLYNAHRLRDADRPIAIVEGEFDVVSVEQEGGCAVGLGSTSNANRLVEAIKDYRPQQPIYLCLDNDDAGKKTTEKLLADLSSIGVIAQAVNIAGNYKDASEALEKDPEAFRKAVREISKSSEQREREAYLAGSAGALLASFEETISRPTRVFPTGFAKMDECLDGGLYPGLVIVGALSSLGKTTFLVQLADQMATQGFDVLFFSLEMPRDELIAKSLSRHTCMESFAKYGLGRTRTAKFTRAILTKGNKGGFSSEDEAIYQKAKAAYASYADHIFIKVGIGDIGTDQIRKEVERHRRITGNDPVVIVDYLQVLAPHDPRSTDKQNTDRAVLELKRMSRDFEIPVIAISSFNRDNYMQPVNLSSFKESGAIEYSSDVLLGMQYDGMDYDPDLDSKSRGKPGREARIKDLIKDQVWKGRNRQAQDIQCHILKNRNGSKGDVIFKFYPAFNYYYEPQTTNDIDSI